MLYDPMFNPKSNVEDNPFFKANQSDLKGSIMLSRGSRAQKSFIEGDNSVVTEGQSILQGSR